MYICVMRVVNVYNIYIYSIVICMRLIFYDFFRYVHRNIYIYKHFLLLFSSRVVVLFFLIFSSHTEKDSHAILENDEPKLLLHYTHISKTVFTHTCIHTATH